MVVYTGNNQVWPGFPGGGAAWTLAGEPLPEASIPLDSLAGPLLAVAGGDDATFWPADYYAERIVAECESAQTEYACQSLIYPDAGHMVRDLPVPGQWHVAGPPCHRPTDRLGWDPRGERSGPAGRMAPGARVPG